MHVLKEMVKLAFFEPVWP